MYFEPSKKNTYRFPSVNSIHEMDSKNYFPDKPFASGESTRLEESSEAHSSASESLFIS